MWHGRLARVLFGNPDTGETPVPRHARITAFAQVRPAPKATKTMMFPGLIRPERQASSSAIGTDAAEVLPYLSMFTKTFSGGKPSLCVAESMMRRVGWWGGTRAIWSAGMPHLCVASPVSSLEGVTADLSD